MIKIKNIGFKIYPSDIPLREIDFYKCLSEVSAPVEFSYFRDREKYKVLVKHILSGFSGSIIYHSNYNLFCMERYRKDKESVAELIEEVKVAQEIGAKKMVLHIDHKVPIVCKEGEIGFDYLVEEILDSFRTLYRLHQGAEKLAICIENTFAPKEFYKRVILRGRSEGMNLGFTFDTGHAKVWSRDSFNQWMKVAHDMYYANVPLHFHIHNNNGVADEHLSVFRKHAEFRPEYSQNILNDILYYAEVMDDATFILETQTDIALEGSWFVAISVVIAGLKHRR